jgi:hypothetical protein
MNDSPNTTQLAAKHTIDLFKSTTNDCTDPANSESFRRETISIAFRVLIPQYRKIAESLFCEDQTKK